MTSQDDLRPRYPMDRRTFVSMVGAGAAGTLFQGNAAAAQPAPKARNVVLVHGLFADGSSWSEVIARLQAAGLNATAVQNPLTTLPEAVASAQRVLARQDGPTVLVGHSFSGMIVTEAGIHPNVSALVYVAARAPDAGEDYTALASSMRSKCRSKRLCSRARPRMRPGGRSRVSMPFPRKTGRLIPISNASWPSEWAPRPSK
jgi:pimeloyl-ACP methyl ester carboxylesterase